MEEEWNIRRGGSIGESARVKERQTRRWSSPSPCARGATARLPRPRKVSPVTFNFRAVGKSPPLELGHRPADSPPPPPAILPYHDDGPSFSPPFPLPRLNFRLVSRFASFEFPNACIRDFSHFFFLPLGHTIDKREEMGRKRFRVFSYTSPSTQLHFHSSSTAESLNFVTGAKTGKNRGAFDESGHFSISRCAPIDRHRVLTRGIDRACSNVYTSIDRTAVHGTATTRDTLSLAGERHARKTIDDYPREHLVVVLAVVLAGGRGRGRNRGRRSAERKHSRRRRRRRIARNSTRYRSTLRVSGRASSLDPITGTPRSLSTDRIG